MADTLAIKYRPTEFIDCVHQSSIIRILERQISTNSVKNCYLFCGASGCGKTTIARIFANKVNGGSGNVIEIDAASNNSVENVRSIVSDAQNMPISSKYKIYILDEVHMLSNAAWNAFLKCIEEPPVFTIFVFCTTDPQKIPATILNRVMRFNLSRIPAGMIRSRLATICENEKFTNYDECVDYISKICDGSLRTAISLLDKVSAYDTELSIQNALMALGDYSSRTLFGLLYYMVKHDNKHIISQIEYLYETGIDLKQFVSQFIEFILDVLKYNIFYDLSVTKFTQSDENILKTHLIFDNSLNIYNKYLDSLMELTSTIKYESNPKSTIEIAFLKMSREE